VHAPGVVVRSRVPEELRHRVFRGSTVVRQGLLTPDELRGPAWVALFRDVHVSADRPVTHALRTRAAAGVLRPGAVVTGRSAAVLWGVDLAAAEEDVELTLPPGAHPMRMPGVRARRALLDGRHVLTHRSVLVTDPETTAVALAASLPLDEAVVAVDRMTVNGLAALPLVRALAGTATGRGCRQARRVCSLADGKAESPQETRLRLLVLRSGLPSPVAQFPVLTRGGRLRLDFAWPEQRVALEHDGLRHGEPGQLGRDRQRLNWLGDAGWRVVFATAVDLHRPAELIARLQSLLTA
jgi:very-short-patch-repair endonuclease